MGRKMGLLSNIVIFMHTLGSTITILIFSSAFLLSSITDIASKIHLIDIHAYNLIEKYFDYVYFIIMFVLLFLISA